MSTHIFHTIPSVFAAAVVAPIRGVLQPIAARPAPKMTTPTLQDLALPELTFTVTRRRVRGVPLTVPAGRYRLTVIGDPPSERSPGGVMMIQLPIGTSLDDAMAEADASGDQPPAFFNQSIMPGGAEIGPDEVSRTVIDLVPGTWIVAGYAMTTEPTIMTVTGRMPDNLPAPIANATVLVGERSLAVRAGRLQAGQNIIRIDNTGEQPHFIAIAQVPRGTQALSRVDHRDIVHVTSTADQSAGTSMWLSVDLGPGTYAVFRDIDAMEHGLSRDVAGMFGVFTVTWG